MNVKNWRYFDKNEDIGVLKITKGQFMTGNILGIIADKKEILNEEGNMLNAKSYDYPVRMKFVGSYTGDNYKKIEEDILQKIKILEEEGCRFIVTTGGQLGLFTPILNQSDLLTVSSPLTILPFVATTIASNVKICIINELTVEENREILKVLKIDDDVKKRCIFTNKLQETYYDVRDKKIDHNECIGAYIWDDREDYHGYLANVQVPVYNSLKICNLIKNIVAHMPYEGVI